MPILSHYAKLVQDCDTIRVQGRVIQVAGTIIEGDVPDCAIGQLCEILPGGDGAPILAEIVGFHRDRVLIMPLGEMRGLKPGSPIISLKTSPTTIVGPSLMGRVLDGLGQPMDDLGPLSYEDEYPIYNAPVNAFHRAPIREPLDLGIRAINGLLTCGIGQRVGIMSGSGVGKSTLLGMIARKTKADVNVIALVGERGRELNDFIRNSLGEEGLARSVVVTATSDCPPLIRVRAAFVATAIAEYFRDAGKNVLLMMDSVTRFAMAQREVGLSIGEPPTTKGYTPSVFALLPKLLERAGMGHEGSGSITGLYTVLVEGDDMNEPIADAVRAILDGHIVLTRDLADAGHFPAIDILQSKSRLMNEIASREQIDCAQRVINLMAAYRRAETLINIGAYAKGSNPLIDQAILMQPAINAFLRQRVDEEGPMGTSLEALKLLGRHAAADGVIIDGGR
jgi:flagellum-specific ATP synthase